MNQRAIVASLAGLVMFCAASSLAAQDSARSGRSNDQAATSACPAAQDARPGDVADSSRAQPAHSPQNDRGPAIILRASASAREVRFAAQPQIVVRLCGGVTDSVRVVERRNLPERIQPGTTYRDVYVAVEILGHLNAQCVASRIGVAPAGATGDPCASITVRDTARAPRDSLRRPPR
jgi:hypothetical protein